MLINGSTPASIKMVCLICFMLLERLFFFLQKNKQTYCLDHQIYKKTPTHLRAIIFRQLLPAISKPKQWLHLIGRRHCSDDNFLPGSLNFSSQKMLGESLTGPSTKGISGGSSGTNWNLHSVYLLAIWQMLQNQDSQSTRTPHHLPEILPIPFWLLPTSPAMCAPRPCPIR